MPEVMAFSKELKEFAYLAATPVVMSLATLYGNLTRDCLNHRWNRSAVGFSVLAVLTFVGMCWQVIVALNVTEPYLVNTNVP